MLVHCLGTHILKSPSDSTFRLLLAQLDLESFEGLPRNWISARLSHAEPIDSLICDGKTLRGSIAENAPGAERDGLRPTSSTSLR